MQKISDSRRVQTSSPVVESTRAAASRIAYVDLLRFLAIVEMVHGHTVNALLAPRFAAGLLYEVWNYVRGLTSVAFLLAAGLAYHITTLTPSAWEKRAAVRTRKRWFRAFGLVALGYWLHKPNGDGVITQHEWRDFISVDVLQCIGVTLGLAQLVVGLGRERKRVLRVFGALAAVFILGAPLLAPLQLSGDAWDPLVSYLTRSGGALFPLFPWSGFFFLGVVCSAWFTPEIPQVHPRRIAIAASGTLICGMIGSSLIDQSLSLHADYDSVFFSLTKTGLILSVAWLAAALSEHSGLRLPGWLQPVARRSLFVYVAHILALYMDGVGLATWVGQTLAPWPAIGAAAAVTVVALLAALVWDHMALVFRAWRLRRQTVT